MMHGSNLSAEPSGPSRCGVGGVIPPSQRVFVLIVVGVLALVLSAGGLGYVLGKDRVADQTIQWSPKEMVLGWSIGGVQYTIDFRSGRMSDGEHEYPLSYDDYLSTGLGMLGLEEYCRQSTEWFKGGGIYGGDTGSGTQPNESNVERRL